MKNIAIYNFLDYLKSKNNRNKNLKEFFNQIDMLVKTFGFFSSLAWLVRATIPKVHSLYRNQYRFLSDHVSVPKSFKKLNSTRDYLVNDHSLDILPGLLHYSDAISMAHGVELRNPFLDYHLVEWIFKLPNHLLFNGNETKWVLREYLRKNDLKNIGNRKRKEGYPVPTRKWIISSKNNEVETLLLANDNPILQWVDKKKINKLINQNKKGVIGAEHHLYKLLSTQIWMQECLYDQFSGSIAWIYV
jgi:asparagine synthase (glutamine-hydrolysing)